MKKLGSVATTRVQWSVGEGSCWCRHGRVAVVTGYCWNWAPWALKVSLYIGPVKIFILIAQNKEVVEITCFRHLMKVPDKTDIDGKRVKLTWLKSAFQVDGNSSPQEVMCAARAYILRLIGGMLMLDKSSAMLCKASKTSNVDGRALNADVGGCMVLLQSWAWYRMPFIAPICAGPTEFPLATRWHNKKEKKALEHKGTIEVRMLIDMWCESQFIWRPYLDEELFVLIPESAYDDVENQCSVMPLIHFALVEMFYGNWVLRQFGYHQPIRRCRQIWTSTR
ncbi:hypothetical protein GQ457_09G017080 [Hibiscus cannabinus]